MKELYDSKGNLKELYKRIMATDVTFQEEKFIVYTYEASSGKTKTIINALKNLYEDNPSIKTLVATKLIKEQNILKYYLGDMALIYNNENKPDDSTLKNYNVLIITHKKYEMLCKDPIERRAFTDDRQLLIIDEQLDILQPMEYKAQDSKEITDELATITIYDKDTKEQMDLAKEWGNIVLELNQTVHIKAQKKLEFAYIEDKYIENKIDKLVKLLYKANIHQKTRDKCIRQI